MRILVIDDTKEQRDYAMVALKGHEVITANGWNEGAEAIEEGRPWDMVLTDLSMPAVEDGQGEGLRYVGQPTPYGFPLALLALRAGTPKVAIVSNGQGDANHHTHPIYWAIESLSGVVFPGRFWVFAGYDCPHMTEKNMPGVKSPWRIKDWAAVVKIISD